MAPAKDVDFFRCFAWLLFLKFVAAQVGVEEGCDLHWTVSVDKELNVSWTGVDRRAKVEIEANYICDQHTTSTETNCTPNPECTSSYWMHVNFSEGSRKLENPCSNALYEVGVSLICRAHYSQSQTLMVITSPQVSTIQSDTPTITSEESVQLPLLGKEEKTFRSLAVVPSPSTDLNYSVTNTSAFLSWREPNLMSGPIQSYKVRLTGPGGYSEFQVLDSRVSSYNTTNLAPYTDYKFEVMAETEAGESWYDSVSFRTQIGVPYPPTNLKYSDVTNISALVTWREPSPVTGPITKYTVRWNSSRDDGVGFTSSLYYYATDLQPYTEYTFDVKAGTGAGEGDWSVSVRLRTKIGVPSPPTELTYSDVTNTSAFLSWREPEPVTGHVLSYTVRMKIPGRNFVTKDNGYNVTNLEPYTDYRFDVKARTETGESDWSESVAFRTEIGVPYPPTGLTYSDVTDTSALLLWREPVPVTGPMRYTVRWNSSRHDGVGFTSSLYYYATDLQPYTEYTFYVKAETEAGEGDWSVSVRLRTKMGVPSVPTNLFPSEVTENSILVEWSVPEHLNAPSVNYTVHWREKAKGSASLYQETEDTSYRIRNILPDTNCSVRIRANSVAGGGPWTEVLYVRTNKVNVKDEEVSDRSSSTLYMIVACLVGSFLAVIAIACVVQLCLAIRRKES